ncbi:Zn-dependent exopeptidase [Meredithblackwellia eburnea MCA 4105]
MKYFTLLLAATATATFAQQPNTTGHLLITSTPVSHLPACATYHGLLPLSTSSHILYFPPSCTSPDGAIPFTWTEDSVLAWAIPSALDEQVEELVERRDRIAFQSLVKKQQKVQESQSAFSASREESEEEGVSFFSLKLDDNRQDGVLVHFSTPSSLSRWTSDPRYCFHELVGISPIPLPIPAIASSFYPPPQPVPAPDVARIQHHLDTLKFNSNISSLLASFPRAPFKTDVEYLTGENQVAPEGEGWKSRHSMSEGGRKASNWLFGQLKATNLTCTQLEYKNGFAPLINCTIPGTDPTSGTVVLGAHFDSRGSFGYPTAPGGDDDGSGTSLILSIARFITSQQISFKRKVIISLFSGEEQGLLGSNWFARQLKQEKEDIVLMVQADMIGYRKPGEPRQIAFPPDSLGLQEARFLLGNISSIYTPDLVPGITPACCSDHQSFGSLGFASTWVFERNNPIADPFYHNSGDLSARVGYDFEQIYLTSSVVLASLLEVAQFELP